LTRQRPNGPMVSSPQTSYATATRTVTNRYHLRLPDHRTWTG
jgi:hypothetical protein